MFLKLIAWLPVASREGVNKRWDTENSNRFKLGIGGLETRDNLAEYVIKNSEPIPDYLQKDKLSHIFSSPFEVEIISDTNFTSNFIEGNIRTKNINGIKNITVYYGELDGLTLENKWSNKIDLPLSPNANEVPFKVSGLDFAKKYFLRVKVIGENGSSWSDSSRLVYTGTKSELPNLEGVDFKNVAHIIYEALNMTSIRRKEIRY